VDASLAAVRERGDDALRELTARFDGVELDELVVPDEVLDESLERLEPSLRAALERAADQVRWFHERARPPTGRTSATAPGWGCGTVPSSAPACTSPAARPSTRRRSS
jgi:histidinol dehydrogenase